MNKRQNVKQRKELFWESVEVICYSYDVIFMVYVDEIL